jgi:predicted nicotinamide N-methyase
LAGYSTKQERVAIAGVDDLLILSLRDRLQFDDPHGDAARLGISSAAWPLFGLPWPSGAQLAARLALRPVVPRERVLEIGCGLALASLVAHRRGVDVTASDRHPLTETFLKANLDLNGLGPMKYRHGDWAPSPGRSGTPPAQLVEGVFDLIVGSDVLYERDADGDLVEFIDRHSAASVEVWIVDPNRGNRAPFSAQMTRRGFSLHEDKLECPATAGAEAYRGRFLTYRRAA